MCLISMSTLLWVAKLVQITQEVAILMHALRFWTVQRVCCTLTISFIFIGHTVTTDTILAPDCNILFSTELPRQHLILLHTLYVCSPWPIPHRSRFLSVEPLITTYTQTRKYTLTSIVACIPLRSISALPVVYLLNATEKKDMSAWVQDKRHNEATLWQLHHLLSSAILTHTLLNSKLLKRRLTCFPACLLGVLKHVDGSMGKCCQLRLQNAQY